MSYAQSDRFTSVSGLSTVRATATVATTSTIIMIAAHVWDLAMASPSALGSKGSSSAPIQLTSGPNLIRARPVPMGKRVKKV